MKYAFLSRALFLAALALGSGNQAAEPTVTVSNGKYAGVYSKSYNQDFFLGILFSQPLVGDFRFQQAQSLNNTWNDNRSATPYSPEFIGYGSDQWVLGNIISEDCSTLHVIRPSGVASDSKLPVAESVYARAPFIAVSINYRLQVWAYLFGQEVLDTGSASLGLRDQRLALHWVQENIATFGGDPTEVTIWGESAGARGVGMQLLAYGGRDDKLFRGAIAQSGGPVGGAAYATPAQWQPSYNRVVTATNCSSSADSLAYLRTIPSNTPSAIFNSSIVTGAT